MHSTSKDESGEPLSREVVLGSEGTSSLLEYLAVVLRHWKLVVILTVCTTGATAYHAVRQPNTYTAIAKFLPPQQQQAGALSAAMMQGAMASAMGGADLLGGAKAALLYVEMIKLDSLRDGVIDRLKLQERYGEKSRQALYRRLNQSVTVQAGKEGIITISVEDTDPNLAAEIANLSVEELKRISSQLSMTGASNSKAFLEEQLARRKEELTRAEDNLKAFQQKYKTLDVAHQVSAAGSAVAALVAQLTSQEVRLENMRQQFADSSPEILAGERAVEVLRRKVENLQGTGSGGILTGFEKIPARGQEYLHLMRKFKAAEAVYESLSKQYEMSRISSANDVSTIQVLQKAFAPERKSGPSRSRMVLNALLLSLFASLGLIWCTESFGKLSNAQRARFRWLLKGAR